MATKPTTTKPTKSTLAADYQALATAKTEATAIERDASGIDAARWAKFDHVVDANVKFATILRERFAVRVGKPTATGNFLWNQMRLPGSPIHSDDAVMLRNLGTAAHFTRCLQLKDRDTAAKRVAYREHGNSANYKRYLTWFDVMAGKADADVMAEWEVKGTGAAKTAKYVKPARTPDADDATKTDAATLPAFLFDVITGDAAKREEVVAAGVGYLERIPADKWADVAAVLTARLMLDAATSAPAEDDVWVK